MATTSGAIERALALLEVVPAKPHIRHGYLDLLGDRPSGAASLGQRLMTSRGLPLIYERLWRPFGIRVFTGAIGLHATGEDGATYELLAPQRDDLVLDVACGPGNITRRLLEWVGEAGLVVGLDASPTMLARAVHDTSASNAAYIRADAPRLPFRDESFNAVCCYAALYLIDDPFTAIDEMVRVLAPGGRVAILTSCERGPSVLQPLSRLATAPGGIRMFGRHEITDAFELAGLGDARQFIAGYAQFVGARKPSRA